MHIAVFIASQNGAFTIELPRAIKPFLSDFMLHRAVQEFSHFAHLFDRRNLSFANRRLQHSFHIGFAFNLFHQMMQQCTTSLSRFAFGKELQI